MPAGHATPWTGPAEAPTEREDGHIRAWSFDDTGEAYDACQCDPAIRNGDVLLVEAEHVVGIAGTWPIAVTRMIGVLHTPAAGYTLLGVTELASHSTYPPGCVRAALEVAKARGWEVRR